jgi:two-component system, sensor histidine kinase
VFVVEGLVPAGQGPRAVAAQRQRQRRLQGLRVAVLDDDATVRDAMRRLLAGWGIDALDAQNAHQDTAHLDTAGPPPDALIADLHLGAGADDGPARVAWLQTRWGVPVPVLWVSAEPAGSPLHARLPPGATCAAKPLSASRLRVWLEALAAEPRAMPDTPAP